MEEDDEGGVSAPPFPSPRFECVGDVGDCVICLDILSDPVFHSLCSNCFCKPCLDGWIKEHPTCPTCREPLQAAEIVKCPLAMVQMLAQIRVQCSGCQAQMEISKHKEHMASCDYIECPKKCGKRLTAAEHPAHVPTCTGPPPKPQPAPVNSLPTRAYPVTGPQGPCLLRKSASSLVPRGRRRKPLPSPPDKAVPVPPRSSSRPASPMAGDHARRSSGSYAPVRRSATMRGSQLTVRFLGTSGAGKSSTVRALRGVPYLKEHVPTPKKKRSVTDLRMNGEPISLILLDMPAMDVHEAMKQGKRWIANVEVAYVFCFNVLVRSSFVEAAKLMRAVLSGPRHGRTAMLLGTCPASSLSVYRQVTTAEAQAQALGMYALYREVPLAPRPSTSVYMAFRDLYLRSLQVSNARNSRPARPRFGTDRGMSHRPSMGTVVPQASASLRPAYHGYTGMYGSHGPPPARPAASPGTSPSTPPARPAASPGTLPARPAASPGMLPAASPGTPPARPSASPGTPPVQPRTSPTPPPRRGPYRPKPQQSSTRDPVAPRRDDKGKRDAVADEEGDDRDDRRAHARVPAMVEESDDDDEDVHTRQRTGFVDVLTVMQRHTPSRPTVLPVVEHDGGDESGDRGSGGNRARTAGAMDTMGKKQRLRMLSAMPTLHAMAQQVSKIDSQVRVHVAGPAALVRCFMRALLPDTGPVPVDMNTALRVDGRPYQVSIVPHYDELESCLSDTDDVGAWIRSDDVNGVLVLFDVQDVATLQHAFLLCSTLESLDESGASVAANLVAVDGFKSLGQIYITPDGPTAMEMARDVGAQYVGARLDSWPSLQSALVMSVRKQRQLRLILHSQELIRLAQDQSAANASAAVGSAVARPIVHHRHGVNVCVVGESGAGKTMLCSVVSSGRCNVVYTPTAEPCTYERALQVGSDIVDLVLTELPASCMRSGDTLAADVEPMVQQSHGFAVLYDVTNFQSYTKAMVWLDMLRESRKPIVLVGACADLESLRLVSIGRGASRASWDARILHHDCSSLTGEGVEETVEDLVNFILVSRGEGNNVLRRWTHATKAKLSGE